MDNKGRFLRLWELSALISLCLCLLCCTWAQGRQDSISSKLLRLHVIAASDEPLEQEVKLQVRDAVLEYLSPRLRDAGSSAEARQIIRRELEGLARAARSAARGRQVQVSLAREKYPSRIYEGFTLPAGSYESLRIVLGPGEGKNWWCILFPPVCLSAAQGEMMERQLGRADYAIVAESGGRELRLRSLELWEEIKDNIRR